MKAFAPFNPYTIENIKTYLKLNGYKNQLVSTEYINSDKKLIFTCENCKCEYEVSFKHLRNAHQTRCNKCAIERHTNKSRLDFEYIKSYFKENGLIILDNKYKKNNQRLVVVNSDGYMGKISYNSLKGSKGFKIIGKSNPYTIYNIKKYIEINKLNCKLLSTEYKGKNGLLQFKCECGNIFNTRVGTLIGLNKFRCDSCSKKQSRLSYLTEQYLSSNGIKYEYEYRFENCKYKRSLPFDFAVFIDNKIKLIECDGMQHYKPVNFNGIDIKRAEESHIYTKKNDDIKNNFCKLHNIELIRIPYWEYDSDNYKIILNNKLHIQA